MNLLHLLFIIAIGFLVAAAFETYRLVSARSENTNAEMQTKPAATIVFSALLGVFLLFASVPGAFFEQPHWFTNKLYWAVERVIEAFT